MDPEYICSLFANGRCECQFSHFVRLMISRSPSSAYLWANPPPGPPPPLRSQRGLLLCWMPPIISIVRSNDLPLYSH
jgi:hypothetical protein